MNEHTEHDLQITTRILADIEAHRVHIAYIESDGYNPSFGYSIGLYKGLGHPELIIIGLDYASTVSIINIAKEEIEKGIKFMEGVNYHAFLNDYPVQFIEVKPEYYPDYLGYAQWYNNRSINFPTLQVVWPDNAGIFPWDLGFNEHFKFKQPLLDRNTTFKFMEERNTHVFTTSEVLNGMPIRYVYHDDDGAWQFHSEEAPDLGNAKLVCLDDLVQRDPTLNEIYYLNYGESAERTAIGAQWKVMKKQTPTGE